VLEAGDVALVPTNVPHDVRNIGEGPLRVFGFFAGAAVVHVFEEASSGDAPRILVTGGPVPIAALEAEPSLA
jgi:oxalate decarboxylase/phosphoglucose isomerase-like protein (cupin superfamily)